MAASRPISDRSGLPTGMARQGITISIAEAMVVAGMYVFLEQWLVPLIQNRLGGSPQHIALALTTVPVLGSVVMGMGMHWVVHHLGGSRRTVFIAAGVQIAAMLLLVPVVLMPDAPWSLPLALVLGCCLHLVGPLNQAGWFAWMGELVPEDVQGRYLGRRNFALHLSRLLFLLIFGLLLRAFPVSSGPGGGTGLLLVIACAIAFRCASALLLLRHPVPPSMDDDIASQPPSVAASLSGLREFLRSAHRTFFGRWTLVWACMCFGTGITGPFIATYLTAPEAQGGMGLAASPLLYAALGQTSSIVRLVLMPLMGRLVDRHGPVAVLRSSLMGASVVTVGWACITDPRLLIANEVFATLCWSGAETAILVLLLTCHEDPAQRPRLVGYYHLLGGVAVVLSSLVGTWLITLLPPFQGSVFRSLFLAGLCIRIPVALAAWWVLASFTAPRPRTDG